ncbi:MAG: hypothetical protein IJ446_08455 [Oscillospiraceae bacterium]|nr:hypothetical protein [Oscillospiraceae bacterium]
MICFEKKGRYGWFNLDKSMGILVKKEEEYIMHNEIDCKACTVYANKGTYFGGMTYAFSSIASVKETGIEVHTGEFTAELSWEELSVILYRDKF